MKIIFKPELSEKVMKPVPEKKETELVVLADARKFPNPKLKKYEYHDFIDVRFDGDEYSKDVIKWANKTFHLSLKIPKPYRK